MLLVQALLMMRIWVDTDFGFDDLWALLLLKHRHIVVDGISLVAGNTSLPQVTKNAEASMNAFNFNWPVYAGADKPLQREPETAVRILGEFGMRSRGVYLPYSVSPMFGGIATSQVYSIQNASAINAIASWLDNKGPHHIIALGPLTNLAQLILKYPEHTSKIAQITWLGGSRGRGNHSEFAEYNAVADPEALAVVAGSSIPIRLIDLELCRQVSFGESDMPIMHGPNQHLVADLLGGYLDIALQRGRSSMSIYDPLAALSVAHGNLFEFVSASLVVHTQHGVQYGRTVIDVSLETSKSNFEIAINIDALSARQHCLSALADV